MLKLKNKTATCFVWGGRLFGLGFFVCCLMLFVAGLFVWFLLHPRDKLLTFRLHSVQTQDQKQSKCKGGEMEEHSEKPLAWMIGKKLSTTGVLSPAICRKQSKRNLLGKTPKECDSGSFVDVYGSLLQTVVMGEKI